MIIAQSVGKNNTSCPIFSALFINDKIFFCKYMEKSNIQLVNITNENISCIFKHSTCFC